MRRVVGVVLVALALQTGLAHAQNSEDVVAGADVALTGGAVVANVHTGGAMWFNPAGVARLDARSVDLTGAVLSYSLIRAPGALSISSGEQSGGDYSAVQAIPRALTFVASPRPALRWGIGFFFSRVTNRFVQDRVMSADGTTPTSDFFATADQVRSIYHASSALGWKKSDKLLFGGGLDIVIATQRNNAFLSGGYAAGVEGTGTIDFAESLSGGGFQMKVGVQYAPIEAVRLGIMVSTPSYLVYLSENRTFAESSSPPGGPPAFAGTQIDQFGGAWDGVEPGLTRVGIAWLRPRGWLEADLIVRFPLQTPALGINWKTAADARVGGIVQAAKRLKLGGGFSTDFSAVRNLNEFAENAVDFYRFTVGFDFANMEKPPERGESGFYLAFAVAASYAYGVGNLVGATFSSTFSSPIAEPNIVRVTINEIGINLAIKAGF